MAGGQENGALPPGCVAPEMRRQIRILTPGDVLALSPLADNVDVPFRVLRPFVPARYWRTLTRARAYRRLGPGARLWARLRTLIRDDMN